MNFRGNMLESAREISHTRQEAVSLRAVANSSHLPRESNVSLSLPGMGVEVEEPGFSRAGRIFLRFFSRFPSAFREGLLFSQHPWSPPLQRLVQRLLGGPQSVRMRFLSDPLRGRRFDCYRSEKYFLMGHSFESEFCRHLRALVHPGDVAYDVGSHAGRIAIFLEVLTAPGGAVFAFEPSPANFRRLENNVALAAHSSIRPVPCGASDVERVASLRENGTMSSVLPDAALVSGEMCSVRLIRLDDFVYRDGHPAPRFIKIDTEGHAGPCLAGMQQLLGEFGPAIACELHDPKEEVEVLRTLRRYHYRIESFGRLDGYPKAIVATVPPDAAGAAVDKRCGA